jgi:hypothetical protein
VSPPTPVVWPLTINNSSTSSISTLPAWNANSYQIISPGPDGIYGSGGAYQQGDANGLLVGARSGERDNITNFSSGVLAP